MVATDFGSGRRAVDPAFEMCPLCDFEGPRIAVYRHIEAGHPETDPADFFSDPVGALD